MIKAEIRTDAGDYKIELNYVKTLKEGWEIVTETLRAGAPFDPGNHELLVICPGAIMKHIRVYQEDDDVIPFMEDDAFEVLPAAQESGAYVFNTANCLYLGNSVKATLQVLNTKYRAYFLPMEINGKPALDMLNPKKLEEFVTYWAHSEGLKEDRFTVVVPQQQLPDYEEALDYLKDYVKETQEPVAVQDRNAKAWQGWKASDNEK